MAADSDEVEQRTLEQGGGPGEADLGARDDAILGTVDESEGAERPA
jgi:hypothetical protein